MTRSPITTHVLDTSIGRPARGVAVTLERVDGAARVIAQGKTNDDGRVADLLAPGSLEAGTYRITFATGPYFAERKVDCFYPEVSIVFTIDAPSEHYHVPLLLNPYGYSTYRGS
ncbi:MAG: hydroxyisourate hydrolase [Sandaracinaceae bacterium]|nr:hydroxyisourate hydrolase [Sandaracinaceae bacterium]